MVFFICVQPHEDELSYFSLMFKPSGIEILSLMAYLDEILRFCDI